MNDKAVDYLGPYRPQREMKRKEIYDFLKGAVVVVAFIGLICVL